MNQVRVAAASASRLVLIACAVLLGCPATFPPRPLDAAVDRDAALRDSGAVDIGVDAPRCPVGTPSEPNVVATTRGLIRGELSGKTVVFKGIPYAAPPVGALRWAPPAVHPCWSDVRDARQYGERCPQKTFVGNHVGSEDCLFVNVWTPALPSPGSDLRPVLFFVHGGAHTTGSSNEGVSALLGRLGAGVGNLYEGRALAEQTGAVVVTINYRLGALGFLAHEALTAQSPDHSSGNYGLLDVVAALRWVQRNIAAFGGDPSRVLLFGESAGAISTCMLLVSPLATGLFSAALMESGACEVPALSVREAQGAQVAADLGCADQSDPLACLRQQPARALVDSVSLDIDFFDPSLDIKQPWTNLSCGPNIDGHAIPDRPIDLIRAGKQNKVRFGIGTNQHEAEIFVTIGSMLTCAALEAQAVESFGDDADEVLKHYPCEAYDSPRLAAIAIATDMVFTCYARRIARAVAASQSQPVFRYYFTHRYQNGLAGLLHAFHAAEIPFVFDSFSKAAYIPTSEERALSNAMQHYWFGLVAAAGAPSSGGDAPAWDPYVSQRDNTLVLDNQIVLQDGVRSAACDFWDSLFGS